MRVRFLYLAGHAFPTREIGHLSLKLYRLFRKLFRVELGLIVVADASAREQLETLRQKHDAELEAQAGEDVLWFRDQQRRILSVRVDTDETDPDAYRELYDRVRGLPESS
jgi:hypothetical protein